MLQILRTCECLNQAVPAMPSLAHRSELLPIFISLECLLEPDDDTAEELACGMHYHGAIVGLVL